MSRVLCERMKGRKLTTSFGMFAFDADGVTDVPEEHVKKLTALKGYKQIEDSFVDQPDEEDSQVEEISDERENQQENDEGNENDEKVEQQPDQEDSFDDQIDEEDSQVEEISKTVVTAETFEDKNVAQLKKIAKDNGIDLLGAVKKNEIIPILIGAMNNR